MPHLVVLLRGVNVGKRNRVRMADFRGLLERLGYSGVETVLNSGNAVFHGAGRSASVHAQAISQALRDQLGVDVPVVVKSAVEFKAAIVECPTPLPEAEHSRFLVVFAQEAKALKELAAVQSLLRPHERFTIGGRAAYLHCPSGILESKVAAALLGKAGRAVTTRNWATVLRLGAQVNAAGT